MASKFQIGDHEFINLSRFPSVPSKRIVREVRAGVSGTTFWNTGTRSTPFSLLSVVNCADLADAKSIFEGYQETKNLMNAVPVTWGGQPLAPTRIMILDVETIDAGMYATLLGIGGVGPSPSYAMLHCRWDVETVNV